MELMVNHFLAHDVVTSLVEDSSGNAVRLPGGLCRGGRHPRAHLRAGLRPRRQTGPHPRVRR